jgi:hypothetical protein
MKTLNWSAAFLLGRQPLAVMLTPNAWPGEFSQSGNPDSCR